MTTCGTCGRQIGEEFAFCPYCGAPSVAAAPAREQRKRVTILFCDVTGSTALGESLDPEALRSLLARYFLRVKGIIESHGGTVEKFIGDAVMAVFGVPLLHEDDALRAVRAALEMQAALPDLGVMARIGIQSGEVVTGTEERLATGDAVNVAARLQQAAQPGEVLMGEETFRLVREAVDFAAIPPLDLKGKSEPVHAYRLFAVRATERRTKMTAMIGRARELDRLRDAFAQAVQDRSCQLFTILGSAGVGKSRLVREFLGDVDRGRILRGRCLAYGEGITYYPVVEILKQVDTLPADEYAAATLRSMLGEKGIAASPEEIAWAFRNLLEEQAHEEPLIVVFDDIHWGEETFLDLIESIADLSRDVPILVLCMARPELLEKRSSWGGGKWNATTILLEPLDARESDELLEALGGVPDEMREKIRIAAEGNPLFVEEMLALIRDSGKEEVTVPPTIQALLAARLDQLAPEERSVLACGAVEGRVFHRSAVQVLAEEGNLQGKLLGLVRKELVRQDRAQFRGEEAYRFRHLLIRDAAYDALSKAVRAELHEKFAGWLEERGQDLAERDEIVGYHLEQAARYNEELGQPDSELAERAGDRLAVAGRQALWRGDLRAAKGLLERALVLLRPLRWDTYLEMDLLESRSPQLDEWTAGLEGIADRAHEGADRRGEMTARVVAAYMRGFAGIAGTTDEVEALARAAIPPLEEAEDHDGLVRVLLALGFGVANALGHFEEWAQLVERAILHGRQIGRPGPFDLPFVLTLGPRPADEALRTLDSLPGDGRHPSSRPYRALLLAMLGRFEEAWPIAREASARSHELTGGRGGELPLADVAMLAGDHEAAARHLRVFCDYLEAQHNPGALSTYAPMLGRSLCMLGRYDEAEPLAQLGRELGDEQDLVTQTIWRQVQALVLANREQQQEAERLAREAIALAERTDGLNFQGDALCDLATVLESAGRAEEAATVLEQALERYERKKNLAMVARVRQRLRAGEDTVPLV